MALKIFKDKVVPNVGDLVSPRSLTGKFTGRIKTEYFAHQLEIVSKA